MSDIVTNGQPDALSAYIKMEARAERAEAQVAALREVLKELSTDWDCCSVSRSMREVARAALEEK